MGVQVLHYRDHHNGGKFDGICYGSTQKIFVSREYPIRIRFKIAEFDSGFQYLWGIGSGNNQYSLKLVRHPFGGYYYLRVTYLNLDYNFSEYKIGLSEHNNIYIAEIYFTYSGGTWQINLNYGDKYGSKNGSLSQQNTSNETLYSIPPYYIYLGASSAWTEGDDIVINGGFLNSDDWWEFGNWLIADGKASHSTGIASEMYQMNIANDATIYKAIYTVLDYSAGSVELFIRDIRGTARTANGTEMEYFNVIDPVTYYGIMFQASIDFVGAIDNVIIKPLIKTASGNKFTGIIYDFDTHYEADGADRQRLVFYEKYDSGVSSDVIYDGTNNNDATITDRPLDFWDIETDISDYIYEKNSIDCKYRQDKLRTPEYPSLKFKLFNYFDVAVGDTIGIKIGEEGLEELCWLFNIYKTDKKDGGHTLLIECEDILMDLKNINSRSYVYWDSASFTYKYAKWWSNYVLEDHEWYGLSGDYYISLFYVLKLSIYLLQYDNILTVDISDIVGVISPYFNYADSEDLYYDDLCFAWRMFISLNKSTESDYDQTKTMEQVFREILSFTRLTFFIKNSILYFYRIASGNETIPDDDVRKTEPEEINTNRKYHEISIDVCTEWAIEERSTDTILYDPVTGLEIWKLITRDDARIWQKKVDGVWVDYDTWD